MSTQGSTVVAWGTDIAPRARPALRGTRLIALLSTTDHKVIGNLYFVTTLAFFCFGGILALLMRAELAFPGLQYFHYERFNQLFTMHGTVMLLFFATPLFVGFSNAIMPLQIGAPDMAFPGLNALAYWMYLAGALIACSGFLTPDGAASFGRFAYAPLNSAIHTPGVGADLWIIGLYLSGLGTILASVNIVTTIITLRAPGMTLWRLPIFCWNILLTSIMALVVFPVLGAALLVLLSDRVLGTHIFDPATGGALVWQHLFWFFGHPEAHIIALPFFAIVRVAVDARGAGAARWSGRHPAHPRGTTSARSPASGPSRRPSTCVTPGSPDTSPTTHRTPEPHQA